MYNIKLINMPFAAVYLPSIGLTQLKSVLDQTFKEQISVDIIHLNHDFALYMGVEFYQSIADSVAHLVTGLGDWFFRQSAFPEVEDNTERYLRRFYPYRDEQTQVFKQKIVEKRLSLDELLDQFIVRYDLVRADLIGFTSMFAQNVASFAIARKLKHRKPELITVMGGANCEAPMGLEIIKQVPYLDYVFSGPALNGFSQLVQSLLQGTLLEDNHISGLFSKANWKHREIEALLNGLGSPGFYGQELDINAKIELNYEPFLDVYEEKFNGINNLYEPCLQFETSRGCWWGQRAHCTFCGLNGNGMNYRAMKPELAIQYINSMFQYADRSSHFECVDNIIPKNYFQQVLPFLKPPGNVDLFYEIKADLSEDDIQALAGARVFRVQPGIEALATSTLKLMRKGTTVFHNLRLLQYCLLHNVYPEWNLLVGFPGETEDVYAKYVYDIPLLVHLPPPSGVYPIRYDRYSPYFTDAEEYNLDLRPMDLYEYVYPFDQSSLEKIAYYFTDRNLHAPHLKAMSKWMKKMSEKFDSWDYRWHGEDKTLFPMLYFVDSNASTIVYDSRSGEEVEHDVGHAGKQLLDKLTTVKKVADLEILYHLPDVDVESELTRLIDNGLVFQEGERVMSLVLSRKGAMSYQTLR